jgi:hypothetical protein
MGLVWRVSVLSVFSVARYMRHAAYLVAIVAMTIPSTITVLPTRYHHITQRRKPHEPPTPESQSPSGGVDLACGARRARAACRARR